MRVRRLQITDYLLLHDLDLRFDRPGRLDTGSYALDFLVGVNGSGKSTVLRALAQIISDLRADRTTDFSYILDYVLQGRDGPYQVFIEQRSDRTKHMRVTSASSDTPPIFDSDAIDRSYLPTLLVIYTTGSEAEWDRLMQRTGSDGESEAANAQTLADPVQRTVRELPGHLPQTQRATETAQVEPPFLVLRATRLPLVTLCGLLAHLASASGPLSAVLDSAGLKHIRGFSLRFRLHTALSDFAAFDTLRSYAARHVRQGNDHLLVFDLSETGESHATKLLGDPDIGGSLALFRKLDRLMDPGASGEPTLQQINILFERDIQAPEEDTEGNDVTRLLLLDWLSDGEQSFLGRMAMLAMLDAEDSLILLDEPEVHFNDYWKREIVSLLDAVLGQHSNHVLITTHSGILLSDVTEGQITLLVRSAAGFAQQRPVGLKTLGADIGDILVSVFGADMATGAAAVKRFEEALVSDDLESVATELTHIGPGMWRFRLRQRLEELNAPSS